MGFVWSGGCWFKYVGEDFCCRGDIWELKYRLNWCFGNGFKKDVCLKIIYGNFVYIMKDVIFGEFVKQFIFVNQE